MPYGEHLVITGTICSDWGNHGQTLVENFYIADSL